MKRCKFTKLINFIPDDCLIEIFSFLKFGEFKTLIKVCKLFYSLIINNEKSIFALQYNITRGDLRKIDESPNITSYFKLKCWDIKSWVLYTVKNDGFDLEYVSEELRNDKEVVMETVKDNGYALGLSLIHI